MDSSKINIIFVPGFLSYSNDSKVSTCQSWKDVFTKLDTPKSFNMHSVRPSPVASLHDRACQIFYQIKGGQTFYGEMHAKKFRHACYGEHNTEALIPDWNAHNPIIFIGHSFGGLTIRYLEHLLQSGFFPGFATSSKWISAVITLNSPLNGSLTPYALGEKITSPPSVWWGSPGMLVSVFCHFWEFIDVNRCFTSVPNFNFSYWDLSWSHGYRGLKALLNSLVCRSFIFMKEDNAAYDMTIAAVTKLNKKLKTDKSTFYLSLSGNLDQYRSFKASYARQGLTDFVYEILRRYLGLFSYPDDSFFRGFRLSDWMKLGHDGVLSTYTSSFPRSVPKDKQHYGAPSSRVAVKPGVWYWEVLPVHHNIAPLASGLVDQHLQTMLFSRAFNFIIRITNRTPGVMEFAEEAPWQDTPVIQLHCEKQLNSNLVKSTKLERFLVPQHQPKT